MKSSYALLTLLVSSASGFLLPPPIAGRATYRCQAYGNEGPRDEGSPPDGNNGDFKSQIYQKVTKELNKKIDKIESDIKARRAANSEYIRQSLGVDEFQKELEEEEEGNPYSFDDDEMGE